MKMSAVISIHDILDKGDWNYNEIKAFLEQDASSINDVDCSGSYPLLRLLSNEKCSVDMVKLFLQYRADINVIMNSCLNTLFFLMCNRGNEICKIFWEKVIESNMYHKYFGDRSPLCVFLNTDMQPEIIKLILNTDRSLKCISCKKHVSSLHCAMVQPNTKFKKEMCQTLIEAGQVFGLNVVDAEGQSFLCHALSQGAEKEVIRLFLKAGCPMNACKKHASALHCTMYSQNLKSKEKIYAILIDAGLGSYMNQLNSDGQSFLCNAMNLGSEPATIKLILARGYRLYTCKKHSSELHCVTRLQDPKYKIDVCQLIIEAFVGADLNKLDLYGQTPICNALQHGAEPELIKLLLNAGCLLDACRNHNGHPLFCATMHSGVLRADTLQLVIDAYAPLRDSSTGEYNLLGESPMRCALKNSIYETEAIKLLYDFEKENNQMRETCLHVAVKNPQCCKPNTVQFLIDQGDFVCAKDYHGKNSLELAIGNNCEPDVIRVLLKNANIDCCQSHGNINPMKLAVDWGKDVNYLEVMLKAGAPLTSFEDPDGSDIMLSILINYYLDRSQEKIDACKLLIKYIYLENPKFKINSLTCGRKCYKVFSDFAKECVREKEIMESNNIGCGYTLFDFIRTLSVNERHEIHHKRGRKKAKTSKKYDLDQLVKILGDNDCHLYSDVISAKICRESIKTKLTNMSICTIRIGSNSSSVEMRIVLNQDCIAKIAEFLSTDELLRLILAFYVPDKQILSKHSEKEKKCVKRKSEQLARRKVKKRRL